MGVLLQTANNMLRLMLDGLIFFDTFATELRTNQSTSYEKNHPNDPNLSWRYGKHFRTRP